MLAPAKAAAGSVGHKVVLKVGKAFGKKFTPWEAVRFANNVGRVAKVGNVANAIGQAVYEVAAEERSAVKAERGRTHRHREITDQILAQADGIVISAIQSVNDGLDELFRSELRRINRLAEEIQGTRANRSGYRDRLLSVRERAESMLAALSRANGNVL